MSTVLIIKGHPLDHNNSRSMLLLNTFVSSYKTHHPEDEVVFVDLYKEAFPEIDEDLLMAWDTLKKGEDFNTLPPHQQKMLPAFDAFTEQFLTADKIVVANPLWNLQVPTRVKAWIDTISVAGKTFKYTDNGPKALTTGKKTLHIQSNGGIYNGTDPAAQYIDTMFKFLGVDETAQLFIEGIDHHPEKAEEMIQDALEKAEKYGEIF